MMGNYGHDTQPGLYLKCIVSGTGTVLAEGGFEIVLMPSGRRASFHAVRKFSCDRSSQGR